MHRMLIIMPKDDDFTLYVLGTGCAPFRSLINEKLSSSVVPGQPCKFCYDNAMS